jgi:hypothetical protein
MKFSKFCVWWGGLGFFLFGWAYLIQPIFMVNMSGMEVPVGPAITDARAMYGGYQIGFGAFTLFCAMRPRLLTAGMLALILAYGGIVICRVVGIMIDPGSLHGAENYHLWAIFILELPVTISLIIGLGREKRLHGHVF